MTLEQIKNDLTKMYFEKTLTEHGRPVTFSAMYQLCVEKGWHQTLYELLEKAAMELEGKKEMKIQQLEAVIQQRDKQILEAAFDFTDMKKLFKETVFRAQLALPEDSDSMVWFEEGIAVDKSGDFLERLYKELNLADLSDEDET